MSKDKSQNAEMVIDAVLLIGFIVVFIKGILLFT